MKVIWRSGQATVREVYEHLRIRRTIALLLGADDDEHSRDQGPPRERAWREGLHLHPVFDGSARPLLVHLLKEKGLTAAERKELQKLLDKEVE